MFLEECKVIENSCVIDKYYLMKLKVSDKLINACKSGQFFMLKCSNEKYLLRRPISLHYADKNKNELEFYYEVKGGGTKNLAEFEIGDNINIQGPLGKGFSTDMKNKKLLIVGGGMGIAPMKLLSETLRENNEVTFIAAGRNEDAVKILDNFDLKNLDFHVATDDGSVGMKGNAIDCMSKLLDENNYDLSFTCGPHGMMVAVAKKSMEYDVECEISLEARMACGVKACVGCSIQTNIGMQKVCHDGPVFKAEDIVDYEPKTKNNSCCNG